MTRRLPTFFTAVALLATPGCADCVIVEERGPILGLFTVNQTPPNQAHAGAFFRKGTFQGPTELDRDGACWLDHYEQPSASPNLPIELDAGELRVTGGLEELVADFNGGYEFPGKTAIFEAGDVLTLHVEGTDQVPSMAVTLPAPPVPVIAPPPTTIDTGEDLTFTWTSPPGTGTLTIQVEGFWPAVKTDSGTAWHPRDIVRCQGDISQGTLTMPASLLFQVSDDGPQGATISAYVNNYERRNAGDSIIDFSVSTAAAAPTGGAYMFDADLKK
jgi:hypothetical protein